MAASSGRMKGFLFPVTVLLLYVVNCTEIPKDCCIYKGLTDKSVIKPSCTDICVFGGGVNLSDCSSISAKKIVQNLVVADFVMISNCNDTALFPKLNTLNPVGEGYAIQMTNCNSSTNTTSFGSLESIAIDVLDRVCGNWETIIDRNNTELHPEVLIRLQQVAQQALAACQPLGHSFTGPILEKLYRLLILPNTTILGYPIIIYEEHYYAYVACFLFCVVTSFCLFFGVPTYITYDFYASSAVKKELYVTKILLACVAYFRPHGDNIIRSMRYLEEFGFQHEYRMLKFLAFTKFLGWTSNAQEEYDKKRHRSLEGTTPPSWCWTCTRSKPNTSWTSHRLVNTRSSSSKNLHQPLPTSVCPNIISDASAFVKDDEEDVEEVADCLEMGLASLKTFSHRAWANKQEAGPVAERRFERELVTISLYEDVIWDMKVRGDNINPYYAGRP